MDMDRVNDAESRVSYDEIAENIFGPLYQVIARTMLDRTGVRSGRLLDVGCGGGHMGLAVCREGDFQGVLLDLSREAVERAAERITESGLEDRLRAVCGNVEDLPFNDNEFDLVVSRGSVFFWKNKERAFREIYRVMKPGAWAYIGGGMGSRDHRERVHALMKERGIHPRRRNEFVRMPDEEYEQLFQQMKAAYQIIRNDEEGHWFLFRK